MTKIKKKKTDSRFYLKLKFLKYLIFNIKNYKERLNRQIIFNKT